MRHIFVPGVGAHGNIGDVVLRRQLLNWLRPCGRLHVYVGASSDDYDQALGVKPGDQIYRGFAPWLRDALRIRRGEGLSYAFKPGEIQLTLVGMKEHWGVLPIAAAAKLRGGAVIRAGVGAKNFAPLPRALLLPSLWLSDVSYWRDPVTANYLRTGSAAPDLAFADGTAVTDLADASERDLLLVSMRGDRPAPSAEWFRSVDEFSRLRGLTVQVVTQVVDDNARSAEIGQRLGVDVTPWSGRHHWRQENELRRLYGRAQMVVSDRLHALIIGMTEGAIPVGLITDSSGKVQRHFDALGMSGVAVNVHGWASAEMLRHLEANSSRAAEVRERLGRGRAELDAARDAVQAALQKGRGGLHPPAELDDLA